MTIPEFRAWPSTPRLNRTAIITEKIDGTNACVIVNEDGTEVWAQSRKRLITPDDDNQGFARWVYENAGALADTLGPGYHYGEWWGQGIQRTYGLDHKRFSLFNSHRWDKETVSAVDGLDVVPILGTSTFTTAGVNIALDRLRTHGSVAAPGYDNPEGIIVYHTAAKQVFKALLESDEISKTEAGLK